MIEGNRFKLNNDVTISQNAAAMSYFTYIFQNVSLLCSQFNSLKSQELFIDQTNCRLVSKLVGSCDDCHIDNDNR